MRRRVAFACLLLALSHSAAHAVVTWSPETIAPMVHQNATSEIVLGVDAAADPSVIWQDLVSTGVVQVRYASRIAPGVWNVEVVDSLPAYVAQTFAVASDGTPHIAYPHAGHIRYVTKVAGSWVREDVNPVTTTGIGDPSLALNAAGEPRIIYDVLVASPPSRTNFYAQRVAGSWSSAALPSTPAAALTTTHALVLDAAGEPHALLYSGSVPSPSPFHWYHDGTGWHDESISATSNCKGSGSLAIDPTGALHCEYVDYVCPSTLAYNTFIRTRTGVNTWIGSSNNSFAQPPNVQIGFDSASQFHQMLVTFATTTRLEYHGPAGSGIVRDSLGSRDPEFAIDVCDRPHTAYFKRDIGGATTLRLWYSHTTQALCGATPTTLALVSADATDEGVALRWAAPGAGSFAATVQRQRALGGWSDLAAVSAGDDGGVRYVDASVEPGVRYGYRLAVVEDGATVFRGEAWVDVPRHAGFTLAAPRPTPADGGVTVSFTLPAPGSVKIEVIDTAGRALSSRSLAGLTAGRHDVAITEADRLAAGVYFVRLTRIGGAPSGGSLTRRMLIVR